MRIFENFLTEDIDIYLESRGEEERLAYSRDPAGYVSSALADAKVKVWIVWILKLALIMLGILGGALIYVNGSFGLVVILSASVYLMSVIYQLSKSLPAWDLPMLEAYWMFLKRGNAMAENSLLFQTIFYHQFFVFPLIQIVLLIVGARAIVSGKRRMQNVQ